MYRICILCSHADEDSGGGERLISSDCKPSVICNMANEGAQASYASHLTWMIKVTRFIFEEYYNPNYGYEPYWKDGHWVFLQEKVLTTDPSSTKPTPLPTICGDECNYLYRRIKHVCARHLYIESPDKCQWQTHLCDMNAAFKTFDSYCQFLDTKCRPTTETKFKWTFVHTGKCEPNADKVFYEMHPNKDPPQRLEPVYEHLSSVFSGLKRTPFG